MERKRVCNQSVTVALAAALFAALSAPAPSFSQDSNDPVDQVSYVVESNDGGVVASDHPLASQTGAAILEADGNAVDAAVTTLLSVGLMNPFASGLGGGGFCLVRPPEGDVDVLDFRERAPGKAHRDMYIEDGEVRSEWMMRGGLAVGVPGEPRGLEALHQKHGDLAWKDVVAPVRSLAMNGYEVGELLPKRLASRAEALEKHPELAGAFRRDGGWVKQGETLRRPRLAKALALLEEEGAKPFYEGDIARAIVEKVNEAGGIFSAADLSGYRVTWREPVRGTYRGHEIYAMPPPSSGGTTLVAALNILERYDLPTLGRNPESLHRITEALKHAFADRAMWLGDSDFVEVPVSKLISKEYAADRRVRPGGVLDTNDYGSAAAPPDDSGTSHVSIIDAEGTMVACTSTINTSFGSMVYVDEYGLVMNNEMGDFTAQPGVANNYGLVGTEQNSVEPGKRPLSSMSPTLVLRDGEPVMAIGASGGPTIITGTLLAIIRTLDWGWEPAAAIAGPRLHHQWRPEILYVEEMEPRWVEILKERGHNVEQRRAYNSVQMVLRKADGTLVGVSDPRKNGKPAAASAK